MNAQPMVTHGARMVYLIKRRPQTSRDELVAHWYKNHMPAVIDRQEAQRENDRLYATGYVATLFDQDPDRPTSWDGAANLWFDQVLPYPSAPHGSEPTDSFQERVEPYVPWPTTEYVFLDGDLPVEPLSLNEPYPTTRSGFFKVVMLVATKDDADRDEFVDHWLTVHAVNTAAVMEEIGAIDYSVCVSVDHDRAPYAGMAELTFAGTEDWNRYRERRPPDDLVPWVDVDRTELRIARTELVGIS